MKTAINYKEDLINLTRELPSNKVKELLDFAEFLKVKASGFSYKKIPHSAEYIRKMRVEDGKRLKSSKNFVEELLEWQRSNS